MSIKLTGTVLIGIGLFMYLQAETLVLQNGANGYTGCTDTYLIMNSAAAQGTKDKLEVEGYHCAACIDERLLIKFDLSSISKTAQVTKATLSLYSTAQPRPGSATVNVYTISKAWDEAAANWTKATSSVSWAKAGGDYDPTAVATYTYSEEVNVWHTIDVTAVVSQFIKNPATNFGLHFFMEPAMYTVRYTSSNSTDQAHRPKLTIEMNTSAINNVQKAINSGAMAVSQSPHELILRVPGTGMQNAELITADGRVVARATGTNGQISMTISSLPAGMYFVSVKSTQDNAVRKILLQK